MIRAGWRSLELFSGAGGLALGTHLAGFRHAALVEWSAAACGTLRANVQDQSISGIDHWEIIQADAREMDFQGFGPIDLVAGGPPCQPFSIAGRTRGMDDSRDMIPEFVRAVRLHLPRAFIMENVRGLLRPGFATYFQYILLQLTYPTIEPPAGEAWTEHLRRLEDAHARGTREPRYQISWRQVNAADYGVPQHRHRVFVVGLREDMDVTWHFPRPTHSREALLHDQWGTGAYWERHDLPWPAERLVASRLPHLDDVPRQPWRTVRDAIGDLPPPLADRDHPNVLNHRLRPGARAYIGHTGSTLDEPAKTLKAGAHGVPGGENMIAYPDGSVRYFTIREAARVQTFPDAWRLEGTWRDATRQVGNAVPVQLARVIATSVAEALEGNRHGSGTRTPTGSITHVSTTT